LQEIGVEMGVEIVVPDYLRFEVMMWYYHFKGAGGERRPGL
jgi:hypothetical protein